VPQRDRDVGGADMRRVLVVAGVLLALAAPAARADVHYGGTALVRSEPLWPTMSLVHRDNGTVAARVGFAFACRGVRNWNLVARLTGKVNAAAFTATGSTRLRSIRMRFTLTGTLAPDSATGTVRMRARGCRGYTRKFVMRTESAPAGPPAQPAANSLLNGLTSQRAAGVRLPVTLRVARNGRVYAVYHAGMDCRGQGTIPAMITTPTMAVRADGSFSRRRFSFTVPFTDGYRERYTISFSGRFLADGAVGTLSARMLGHKRGRRYVPCVSGTQTWAART
jgi:hypothetical protein